MNKPKTDLKSEYNVPNLERGLMVIELLATKKNGLTLAEITETLALF